MRPSRPAFRRRQSVIIEACEPRTLFNGVYHPLNTGPLLQDWSDPALISAHENWNIVPSIIGYGGNALTSTEGVDPRTVTAFAGGIIGPVTRVVANQTQPGLLAPAGIAEFELESNPTVALAGTSANDAPFLMFHLDTTGVANIPMSFTLRDIDPTDSTISPVTVQYRIGTTGVFTDISSLATDPTAIPPPDNATIWVEDATDATDPKTTHVAFILPPELNNLPQVQIRIMTTNAVGNDEWVGVDDIRIGEGLVPPVFEFSQARYTVRENEGFATITVTRSGNVTVAAEVLVSTAGGNATPGDDYTAVTNHLLQFAPDETERTFDVLITDDADEENAERVLIQLHDPNPGQLGEQQQTTLIIVDNDSTAPPVLLNEIEVNPGGNALADGGYEYVELRGLTTGDDLKNVYFVSLEGDAAANAARGIAKFVVDLGEFSVGNNDLLMIKSPTTGHESQHQGTTIVTHPGFDTLLPDGILENGANSFLIIFSPVPIEQGDDLDGDDNGVLELDNEAVVIDGVAWKTSVAGDLIYGPDLSLPSGGLPGAATRFLLNSDPLDRNAWYWGNLETDRGIYDLDYDPATVENRNPPTGLFLTPGRANMPSGIFDFRGVFSFEQGSYVVNENVPGGILTIKVIRSSGDDGPVSVQYDTLLTGSAASDVDYVAASGVLSFADGETEQTFTITINDDGDAEIPEQFFVQLSNPTGGATLSQPKMATITIADNDVVPPTGIILNEVEVNPPTNSDNPYEFIELRGNPNQSLAGIHVVVLEGDGAEAGQADLVFNLSNYALGSNGLALIKSTLPSHGLGSPLTTVIPSTLLNSAALEEGAISFLLVYSLVPIAPNTDFDTDNDGNLDLPLGVYKMDGVGWKFLGSGTAYGAILETANPLATTPHAATRLRSNLTPESVDAWYTGTLAGPFNSSLPYQNGSGSPNMPADAVLTPGGANFDVVGSVFVEDKSFNINTSPSPMSITVSFNSNVNASIVLTDNASSSFRLENLTTHTFVPAANMSWSYSPDNTVTITFPAYMSGALPDGHYRFTIQGANISNGISTMAGNESMNFAFLNGDATGDFIVDTQDFNVFAGNYGATSGKVFSDSDFTFDGKVNSLDFNVFVGRYGTRLAQPATQGPPISGNWSLSFVDEFNGAALGPNWTPQYWWHDGDHGVEPSLEVYRPEALSVANGMLSITATEQETVSNFDGQTYPYQSGIITTGGSENGHPLGFSFTYGYVEARVKIPAGQGLWPAFWMLPASRNDEQGEIDIFEVIGSHPEVLETHYHEHGNHNGEATDVGVDLSQDFHTYAVHWEAGRITWYLDNQQIFTWTTNVVAEPLYLILNLGVGGDWPGAPDANTVFPAVMQVDYVKVWQTS